MIRQSRDALYSANVADISQGASLTLPGGGGRYMSAMLNQDHHVNRTFHEPDAHELSVDEFDTPYVVIAVRTLVDPNDADDVAAVNARVRAEGARCAGRRALVDLALQPDGYFQANDRDAYSINSITAVADDDGTITVDFGGCIDDRPNCLPIMDGWNYIVSLPSAARSTRRHLDLSESNEADSHQASVVSVPRSAHWLPSRSGDRSAPSYMCIG